MVRLFTVWCWGPRRDPQPGSSGAGRSGLRKYGDGDYSPGSHGSSPVSSLRRRIRSQFHSPRDVLGPVLVDRVGPCPPTLVDLVSVSPTSLPPYKGLTYPSPIPLRSSLDRITGPRARDEVPVPPSGTPTYPGTPSARVLCGRRHGFRGQVDEETVVFRLLFPDRVHRSTLPPFPPWSFGKNPTDSCVP